MKRLISIARAHGIRTLLVRSGALVVRVASARLQQLRDRLRETRDALLPLRPFTVSFPESTGEPRLAAIVVGTGHARESSALLRMLRREVAGLGPCEVHVAEGISAAQLRGAIAQASAAYVYVVRADAVLRLGCVAALVETLERHPEADAALSQSGSGADFVHRVTVTDAASILWRRDAVARGNGDYTVLLQPRSRVDVRGGRVQAGSRARPAHEETVLVVDDHVPFHDRDAGSERMAQLVRLMKRHANVVFASVERRLYGKYAESLRDDGIEVVAGFDERALRSLARRETPVTTVWLSRPDVAARFVNTVRELLPAAYIVYDTVDLHFVRLQRRQAATGVQADWERYQNVELTLARASDCTVVTSSTELAVLRAHGIEKARVVGMAALATVPVQAGFEGAGIVFFGNYAHSPNVDAAVWLARDIFPAVRSALPGITLTIAGSDPTPEVQRLASDAIVVTGHIADIDALIVRHRLAVFPLRFGAGIKGKVLRAMACGIPIVTSVVGAEGIVGDGVRLAIAGNAREFAREIVLAYTQRSRWQELAAGSVAGARAFSLEALDAQLSSALSCENA